MITYYPDGSWSTEAIGTNGVAQMRREIERLNDEPLMKLFDTLVRDYIRLAECDGSFNYTDDCDHDCRDCEYADCCEDCEYCDVCDNDCENCEHADYCEVREVEMENAVDDAIFEPTHEAARVYMCRDCEFHVVGFPCSRTTKMKKGCGK